MLIYKMDQGQFQAMNQQQGMAQGEGGIFEKAKAGLTSGWSTLMGQQQPGAGGRRLRRVRRMRGGSNINIPLLAGNYDGGAASVPVVAAAPVTAAPVTAAAAPVAAPAAAAPVAAPAVKTGGSKRRRSKSRSRGSKKSRKSKKSKSRSRQRR
jgi:hypothetical protein